jgi:hypothetical protein
MRPDVIEKLKNDRYFRRCVATLYDAFDHTDCDHEKCMYVDFLVDFERFFQHEYGITPSDCQQVSADYEREYDEKMERSPKCCDKMDFCYGKCRNCGIDMIDIPGYWEMWKCPDCGEPYNCCVLECRYAVKNPCPFPDRHEKQFGYPAPQHKRVEKP